MSPSFQGRFQIYTGEGKGKTTASLGLAVRAVGNGFPVYIGQFMKGRDYGELHGVRHLPGLVLEQYGSPDWVYEGKIKPGQRQQAEAGLEKGKGALTGGAYRIVIMDELNVAIRFGLLPLEAAMELVKLRPADVELIITGRDADPALMELADLVTEMNPLKHYFSAGQMARRGIEY